MTLLTRMTREQQKARAKTKTTNKPNNTMTLIKNSLLAITIASAFFAVSCEKKTEAERTVDKVENKIKDATDSRPAEGIRDAAEDITK